MFVDDFVDHLSRDVIGIAFNRYNLHCSRQSKMREMARFVGEHGGRFSRDTEDNSKDF